MKIKIQAITPHGLVESIPIELDGKTLKETKDYIEEVSKSGYYLTLQNEEGFTTIPSTLLQQSLLKIIEVKEPNTEVVWHTFNRDTKIQDMDQQLLIQYKDGFYVLTNWGDEIAEERLDDISRYLEL